MADLQHVTDSLQIIVKEAGLYMLGAVDAERDSEEKTNSKDFVTIADIKSQNLISAGLRRVFPDVQVISEEDSKELRATLYDTRFTGFVVDPIDGTYNFKRDMRESGVSIGYIESGEAKAGVIYDPYKDELFSAVRGGGAYCNDKRIRVSDHQALKGASVATSNSYDDAAMARNLKRHLAIYEKSGIMPWTNCPGSGVLIMANIACGRFDAYHHNGLKPWDNAAAFLLVREAGGVVERLDGKQVRFTDSTVLIGCPAVVNDIKKIFVTLDPKLLS